MPRPKTRASRRALRRFWIAAGLEPSLAANDDVTRLRAELGEDGREWFDMTAVSDRDAPGSGT
jgi:hypothetical protein